MDIERNLDFFKHVYAHPSMSRQDLHEVMNKHQPIIFKKGDFFLKNGDQANEYYLIESGLLRVYVHDFDGNEITTDFHGENEISIEVSSLFQRVPSQENIVALSEGMAWKICFSDFQQLFHGMKNFREWGRAWMSNQLFESRQRQIEMITKNAAERYENLIHHKPNIIKVAPIRHVASYLGITDTSLSRIRKNLLVD